ncbi:hypothetical protein, partial [Stenotrophomonas sp. YIM B06876]|uniref:hypothetical protein n=1 Tax=Stenotrophomonas sp. YIM B06876 TaxID=3060211 RepID=UPI002738B054
MVAAQLRIQGLGLAHLFARRLGAHRHVAARFAALQDGRDVGLHPVKAAVLAPVLDQPRPGLAAADGGPHVLERLHRHVGVADQVVRLANEFIVPIAAGVHESRVAVRDGALGVGGGDQHAAGRKVVFIGGHGQIDAHARGSSS